MEAQQLSNQPNIVVFGVSHSGTSVVTKMLGLLGWHLNDADEQFVESLSMTSVNRRSSRTKLLMTRRWLRCCTDLIRPTS